MGVRVQRHTTSAEEEVMTSDPITCPPRSSRRHSLSRPRPALRRRSVRCLPLDPDDRPRDERPCRAVRSEPRPSVVSVRREAPPPNAQWAYGNAPPHRN